MENDNRNYHETQPWRIVDMMIEMASFMSYSNSSSDVFVTIHFSIDSQSIALCDHRIIVWCCFELFICFAFFFIAILSPTSSNSGCVCNFFCSLLFGNRNYIWSFSTVSIVDFIHHRRNPHRQRFLAKFTFMGIFFLQQSTTSRGYKPSDTSSSWSFDEQTALRIAVEKSSSLRNQKLNRQQKILSGIANALWWLEMLPFFYLSSMVSKERKFPCQRAKRI